ncbi:hypothetical protein [Arthrobacter psychrolactophilus]
MTARLYDLTSSWTFDSSQQDVWDVITAPDMSWPNWWPGCTLAKPLESQQTDGASKDDVLLSTTATLNFKASLGYTLKVAYHPTFVDSPREVDFDASGDLAGNGRVFLSTDSHGQTQMDIEWRVQPTRRWMTLLSPLAGPAFTYAHAALMRKGESGLRDYLIRQDRQR